jgi:hypothetical protein
MLIKDLIVVAFTALLGIVVFVLFIVLVLVVVAFLVLGKGLFGTSANGIDHIFGDVAVVLGDEGKNVIKEGKGIISHGHISSTIMLMIGNITFAAILLILQIDLLLLLLVLISLFLLL